MKPSGIEWIGDIPDDWEVRRGKYTLDLLMRPIRDNDEIITCFRDGQVTRRSNRREDGFTFADKEIGYQGILKGDLVIHGMDGFAGAIGISDSDGKGSPVLNVCRPKNGSDTRYINYYLRTLALQNVFIALSTGIRERSCDLRWKKIAELLFTIPPLKTQQRIADYLDEKCGEIDATIAKQKESIEKLKAYKQSLISETVTKGLDKSAPLKPSGIEWIGNIPDDWEVTKISRLYSIQLGKMLQPEKKSSGDTYEPYICAANLSSGTFRLDEVKYMWISEPEKDIYRLKRDDLLVTEGGDVGISSIWKDDISPCYFQNALHRVVPKKGSSNRFLHYWLIVLKSVGYIDLICNKSTIAHFTKEKFAQSLILSIPLQTQEKIADYLDSKCSQIDKYITEKQNIIQKLDAYKKSLIFECVTGKKRI